MSQRNEYVRAVLFYDGIRFLSDKRFMKEYLK